MHLAIVAGRASAPPPPLVSVQKWRPRVSALLGFHWNQRVGGSNPMENQLCSFVQAAGKVNMGVKVLVQVSLSMLLYSGVLDTLLYSSRCGVGLGWAAVRAIR